MGHPNDLSQLTSVSPAPSPQSTCTESLVWSQLPGPAHIPTSSHRANKSTELPQGPSTILQTGNQGPERCQAFQSHTESQPYSPDPFTDTAAAPEALLSGPWWGWSSGQLRVGEDRPEWESQSSASGTWVLPAHPEPGLPTGLWFFCPGEFLCTLKTHWGLNSEAQNDTHTPSSIPSCTAPSPNRGSSMPHALLGAH